MKNIVSFIGLFALLVSGCSHEEVLRNGTSGSNSRTFTASFERNESRTYLEDGYLSCWNAGDCISLFEGNTLNCEYMFDGGTGENEGTFSMVNKLDGNGLELAANYAVYPYASDVKVSERGVIAATLPSEQHYAEKSFGLGDNTMVAVTDDTEDTFLSFKNVGGFLKFQLYGDDVTIKSITLIGNNGEKIAGKAAITVAYGEAPVVKMEDDATTSITLDCGEEGVKVGSSVEAATSFWMVLPSVTFEKGITIMVRDVNGGMFTQTTSKELVIERNVVKPMKAVNVEPEALKLAYSTNQEELEGWAEGLFCSDGIYYMSKPSDGDACVVTIGNFLTEENCLIYIDENRHVREIFSAGKIFTFNNYTDLSVDISFFDEDNVRMTETVEHGSGSLSRSSDNNSQEANGINLGLNMWSIKEAVNDIAKTETTYKYGRGWQSYLLNVFNGLGVALEIGGGPEDGLFDNMITDWIGGIDNSISIGEMGVELIKSLKIKDSQLKPGPGGPAVWAITAWLGFRATYLELYEEHIKEYYGSSIASIANVAYENGGLSFDLNVSGYENWYNMECGVIVKQSNLPIAPIVGIFPSNIETKEVAQNGNYSFFVDDKQNNESYWCYPFLVSKSRDPLWRGFIGEIAGPLVRYGTAVKYGDEESDENNGHNNIEAVDLGLSVKWASCNLGAEKPEAYGDYFAFGEIEPKSAYGEENWTNPGVLQLSGENDAATRRLGRGWRMPSKKECEELLTECSWELITIEGVKGYQVTGKNGNSIFLPLTGSFYSKEDNYEARYRTSEAYLDDGDSYDDPSTIVMELQQKFSNTEMDSAAGWGGHPIRPVLSNIVGKWIDDCEPACYYMFEANGTGLCYDGYEVDRIEWSSLGDNLYLTRITPLGQIEENELNIKWIDVDKIEITRIQTGYDGSKIYYKVDAMQ